jgi:signal transduction histidine kinase
MTPLDSYEKRFEILDQTPYGCFVIDSQYRVLFWNSCLARWSKVKKEDIVNKDLRTHFPHFEKTKYSRRLEQLFQGGPPVIFSAKIHHHIIPARLQNDELQMQQTMVTSIDSFAGKGFYALFTIQDATEQIYLIDQLRAKDRALHEAEKLQQAENKIKVFADELEKFVYTASHDLQEPLRKIIIFGDRLKDISMGKLEENGIDCISRMQKASFRMKDLIEDLLGYSQLNHRGNKFEPLNLNTTVQEVISDLEIQISETKGNVQYNNLPIIEADKIQMRQLFQNLISNGLKYKKPDTPPQIKIRSSCDNNNFHTIFFEDNGVGFDLAHKEKVFQPFERLHSDKSISGSGMGLFICKKIVASHRGEISVQSQLSKGSAFLVSLPEKQLAES